MKAEQKHIFTFDDILMTASDIIRWVYEIEAGEELSEQEKKEHQQMFCRVGRTFSDNREPYEDAEARNYSRSERLRLLGERLVDF